MHEAPDVLKRSTALENRNDLISSIIDEDSLLQIYS